MPCVPLSDLILYYLNPVSMLCLSIYVSIPLKKKVQYITNSSTHGGFVLTANQQKNNSMKYYLEMFCFLFLKLLSHGKFLDALKSCLYTYYHSLGNQKSIKSHRQFITCRVSLYYIMQGPGTVTQVCHQMLLVFFSVLSILPDRFSISGGESTNRSVFIFSCWRRLTSTHSNSLALLLRLCLTLSRRISNNLPRLIDGGNKNRMWIKNLRKTVLVEVTEYV